MSDKFYHDAVMLFVVLVIVGLLTIVAIGKV